MSYRKRQECMHKPFRAKNTNMNVPRPLRCVKRTSRWGVTSLLALPRKVCVSDRATTRWRSEGSVSLCEKVEIQIELGQGCACWNDALCAIPQPHFGTNVAVARSILETTNLCRPNATHFSLLARCSLPHLPVVGRIVHAMLATPCVHRRC